MLWTTGFGRFGSGLSPWAELERMENEMNRMLSRYASPPATEFPAFNIWESADQAVVTTEIPGIEPNSIDISVVGSTLTIKGEKEEEKEDKGKDYYRMERSYGSFVRSIPLPVDIDTDKVQAIFKKGLLQVVLPKSAKAIQEAKKIAVKPE